ncbi:MAG: hypothetical protein J5961_01905 [Mogibacterium sp.]|nr:hypothetical protein [Mogibacterium sp.]
MDRLQEKHYEELFNGLLGRGKALHASNKKRIRIGLIFLAVFTVGMIVIRRITESDRASFLIIWVIGMFAISIYLIGVEYIDTTLAKTLEEFTERDAEWDGLIPDSESVMGRMQTRIDDRRGEVKERLNDRREELHERMQPIRDALPQIAAEQAADAKDAQPVNTVAAQESEGEE